MRSLLNTVKKMSVKQRAAVNHIEFLDSQLADPLGQKIVKQMDVLKLPDLGIEGTSQFSEPYYFTKNLNRVVIEGSEDYRLVLFFIRKGTFMPLHDHPNMSVYFKLMFGKLRSHQLDKIDSKYKYNDFTLEEYMELIETNKVVKATKTKESFVNTGDFVLVKPSLGNMHTFVAEEDSCFFDICIPNYSMDIPRKQTYFLEVGEPIDLNTHYETKIRYDTTPPTLPEGMEVADLDYVGDM